jgi:hypothetical protein
MQPDAASRPQDRADFGTQIRLERHSESMMAARLNGKPLDPHHYYPTLPDLLYCS